MKIEMTDKERKILLKAQQGEMDAVLVYRNLANVVKVKGLKEQFNLIAAEEGKHASILKTYTETVLKPKAFKSVIVLLLFRTIGLKNLVGILAKRELKASAQYETLITRFKKVKEIMADEKKHADIISKMSAQ